MNNKKVSIIMSTYNEKKEWLSEAIESLLNQTYKNLEIIIILDKPDNYVLKEVIEKYSKNDKRIIFKINSKNLGLVKSLNIGIELATGDYIARMDADDISHNQRIEKQVNFLEQNPHYSLIGSKCINIDENNNIICENPKFITDYKWIKRAVKYRNVMCHPTFLFKKEILDTLVGYRDINYCEDYDFILRAIHKGFVICNLKEVLLYYRIRNNGISESNKVNQKIATNQLLYNYKKNIKFFDRFDNLDMLIIKNRGKILKRVFDKIVFNLIYTLQKITDVF